MGGQETWALLQKEIDDLKILDAHTATVDVMYGNQKWFEYRYKPNRKLARLLEEHSGHRLMNRMKKTAGTVTLNPVEKSKIFADYYRTLYTSNMPTRDVDKFLEKLKIP